jgi:DNA-binding NtrC family response regulator
VRFPELTSGNKSRAASLLGISRQTLREKLKTFQAAAAEKAEKEKSEASGAPEGDPAA